MTDHISAELRAATALADTANDERFDSRKGNDMNTKTIDADVDGIQSIGQAAESVVKTASQALTPRPDAPPPAPMTESATVLQIIDRAARDPSVDIDKMKQLMEMRDKMRAQQAELEFDTAMSAAQEAMQPVRADASNPSTKSKYASFAALDSAIRPIYTKHGFSVTFDTADCPKEGYERIVAKVAHPGGHRERPHIDMPSDGKGAKGGDVMTKTHATGSAVQYGRRYLLGMIFNIAVSKDDDGNAAGSKPQAFITEEQVMELRDLLTARGANEAKFLAFIKVDSLDRIYASAFEKAVEVINAHRKSAAA